MNLPTNPIRVPSGVFVTSSIPGIASVREEDSRFADSVPETKGPAPCSCADDMRAVPTPKSSAAPRIPNWRRVGMRAQGIATAATKAADDAICAIVKTFFNVLLPRTGFSGTTIVSPGPSVVESTPPDQRRPCEPLVTEPSERTMKIAPLLASCVAPPARERYQLALLPGV